ncbi:4'-phosphopantetheinyl transferase superfamily protein [Caballeronia sp. ATUFL_M2_KS44]|uniref:4'-phosphopantetheinyl transferase family protein n=1 Tax=Caballeronia sp. ATUFL_M2_KS44 TaxID=2921767 RepID=UPI0020279242|nr:4'-phosphopantetheinyl transferase superfamily protein [Caballeronia sp. ATUFL_M2_KS44]
MHLLAVDAPADVRVWRVDIDLDAPLERAGAGLLDANEMARAHRFIRHEDAARFVTMRACLRRLLAAPLDIEPSQLQLDIDTNGRPLFSMPHAPDFNVSHSGAQGLIAISFERRVGVDIEEARPSFDWRELEASVLHHADKRVMDATPDARRSGAFFACWTAKEALLKAHGDGIGGKALTMTSFSVLPRDGARYAVSAEAGAFEAVSLAAPDGYAAALAWSRASRFSCESNHDA